MSLAKLQFFRSRRVRATAPGRASRKTARDILSHNLGFDQPDRWIEYAQRKEFCPVEASPLPECPDCGTPGGKVLGQYVHYSTLLRLRECLRCGLIWSDGRIDGDLVVRDFERTYHGGAAPEYFSHRRRPVFQYLATVVARATPRAGRVLDIGGAQGHLMSLVRYLRPDLTTCVNDISTTALDYAADRFGLPVISGGLHGVRARGERYHVLVMSDVLYYEPDLRLLWQTLPELLEPNGLLLVRMPNKLPLLRAAALIDGLRTRATGRLQDRVPFFNPQHVYVMSPAYLANRLGRLGFGDIRIGPSPMLVSSRRVVTAVSQALFTVLVRSQRVLHRSLVLTPSFVMSARWPAVADQAGRAAPSPAALPVAQAQRKL